MTHFINQLLILRLLVAALCGGTPGVISTSTNAHDPTQHGDWISFLLLSNKRVLYSTSFAKKTAPFLGFRAPFATVHFPCVTGSI
ncbi:hypothetical protein, partial [Methylomonas methanica]|uniref:hypothetical protein n=1 Tax=Methylomonas methanica TaxID=421 RepID=UPI0025705822